MRKIKVLHMPVTNSGSGVTQYILQNWKFIDQSKYQFDFATRSKKLDFAEEIIFKGNKIHYLSCSAEDNKEQFIYEMNAILDEGYDVIHLHTSYWKGFLVEELAIARNIPIIIVHSHSTMIDIVDEGLREACNRVHQILRNTLPLNYATHFAACSSSAAEWLFGEQIPRQRIQILKNAIDVSRYSFNTNIRTLYRKELGLNECFVIGHVGRFTYSKNHAMLIDIFNELYRYNPHSRLMLVGTGELEGEIRRLVINRGLEHAVLFLGRREDVPNLMQAMDAFLLPSHFEGLGLVLIEAQAAGLQCIASEAVALEAKVTQNVQFLKPSVSEWVSYLMKIAEGYERINQDKVIEAAGYDIRNQIEVIEKLYSGLIP